MSILIKGMEMPKEKPLIIKISQDGTVYMSQGIYGIGHGVATAVPVPPHGRCVDADKLMQEMCLFIKENMLSRDDARELLETIEDAPTIIPAEPTEEGK